jgi:hypothetical protein
MTFIVNEAQSMQRHRVEMTGSIIFDVVMPDSATDEEIKAQAAMEYKTAVDRAGGFTLCCALHDCRVYVNTIDGLQPADIEMVDMEIMDEDEPED